VAKADAAFDEFAISGLDEQLAMPVMMSAGAAVEQCLVEPAEAANLEALGEAFPQGSELVAERITDLAADFGERAGVDTSAYVLHRWDPPDH